MEDTREQNIELFKKVLEQKKEINSLKEEIFVLKNEKDRLLRRINETKKL